MKNMLYSGWYKQYKQTKSLDEFDCNDVYTSIEHNNITHNKSGVKYFYI